MHDTEAALERVSDEALARRIASGPAGSTDGEEGELYRRFAPRVRLYGRRHLRNDMAADDLAQEVLLLTIERLRAGEVRQPEEIGSVHDRGFRGLARRRGVARSPAHCGGSRHQARRGPRDQASRDGAAARLCHGRGRAMTADACDRISFADLVDYAAGELPESEAAAIEEHLFSCAGCSARAAEVETRAAGIASAARAADIGGFVTDAVLNRLSRDGVRVRTFALSPGAAVPCAVWDDDELMVLRLRADFGSAREVTLSQRVGGSEVVRVTAPMDPSQREILHATPAAIVRQLPAADVEVFLTTSTDGEQRTIGSCTLVHGGSLHRR